jgi:hypothetical protein
VNIRAFPVLLQGRRKEWMSSSTAAGQASGQAPALHRLHRCLVD